MQNRTFHHAFKIDYPFVVNEIKTDVLVAVPQMINKNPNKKAVQLIAIWDTGATNTVISEKVVNELGLIPIDIAENYTAGGIHQVNVYYIDIVLPNNVVFPNLRVIECPLVQCDVLVGMDIISQGDLAIANANNKTHFSYCIPPHKNPVCLYEKSLRVNPK